MVVEAGSPKGIVEAKAHMEATIMLGPNKALATIEGTQAQWEIITTDQLRKAADEAITRIKWKTSVHGGRTWAKPLALDRDIGATKARAKAPHQQGHDQALLTIRLSGPLGADPNALMTKLMEVVQGKAGIQLQEKQPRQQLKKMNWAGDKDAFGDWSGIIKLQLDTKDQAAALAQMLRGYAVDVGGYTAPLDVHSPFVADWNRQDATQVFGGAGPAIPRP